MNCRMRGVLGLLMAVLLSTATSLPTTVAQAGAPSVGLSDRLRATDKALRWLYHQQKADGGFGEPGSDPELTSKVVLAFAAAYEDPDTVELSGESPMDYLVDEVGALTSSAEGTALLILTAVAGDEDPRAFGGSDLIATLEGYRQSSGQYYEIGGDGIAAQDLAIMALEASKEDVPSVAVSWLIAQQNADGGWGPQPGQDSATCETSLSIQALIAAGESTTSPAIEQAILYLRDRWTANAGFAASSGTASSDPASTAQAIQGLLAAGENLLGSQWHRCVSTSFDALLDSQSGDGSFEGSLDITAAAVLGIMGRSLPLPGRYVAALKGLDWLHDQQQEDGGFGNGGFTADAVYAIAMCGQDPDGLDWTKASTSAMEALETQAPAYIANGPGDPPGSEPAGELGKVIRAVSQAGDDPYSFAGTDLVEDLKDTYDESTGRYHPDKTYSHDLALIALHAVSEPTPGAAVTTLEHEQTGDGGWPWAWGATSADVDSTGLSMQAIVAGGGPSSDSIIQQAASYLESLRFTNGGYPDIPAKSEPNCDSTSLAIQGLLAAGKYHEEPLFFAMENGALASSWDALLSFQESAGSFVASASVPESRLLATVEALHALCSPLYPGYQPLPESDQAEAGTAYGRMTCGNGFVVVAPYLGDDDQDGWVRIRYRVVGQTTWSEWAEMSKGGLYYLVWLDLQARTGYEIEVAYDDPDGVTGTPNQEMQVYTEQACIPMAARNRTG
jgi:prenyltransferase beta subunit